MANNEVRIIGGQWRGRKLKFPARGDLRPTLGRVRETLFNWLAPVIHGARCLDLFAGSGALGFEALSRGAAEVTFVERDRKAAEALSANVALLGASARVCHQPAARFLAHSRERFGLVFFDPPFADRRSQELLGAILDEHLEPDGLLYLECGTRSAFPDVGRRVKEGRAGDCRFALLAPADR